MANQWTVKGGKPSKPKAPGSAYVIFRATLLAEIQVHTPSATTLTIIAEAKSKWTAMKPTEKERYEVLSQEAREKYEESMIEWENLTEFRRFKSSPGEESETLKNLKGVSVEKKTSAMRRPQTVS
ncbi:hypothetical protein TrLO_g7601 [Triparma laevis f. longispina]|uniref:HMG box domain-containing protein n=1 Tax=Triparma laevis f. longispina TaxID=1714387 RepID=A0A9W7CFQ5_9STRA|nr:hypothetical protein TrLO_g7601 [Triparma laevis f. longispina]